MKQLLTLIILALAFNPVFAFSQTNKNYITIGYTSVCCGTPSEKPVMDFVKYFEKENKLKTFEIFVELGLGKEGEHAFHIGTANLDTNQLKSFWNGLKITASNQNNQRLKGRDGFLNVDAKLTSNSTLKSIKTKPGTNLSPFLEIYDHKK